MRMRYELDYSWEVTDDGLDMTQAELIAEAMEPGGPLDGALFEHHVVATGQPRWHLDTATDEPRLRVSLPVAGWHTRRDPLPLGRVMQEAVA